VERITADADDDVVSDHDRRGGAEVLLPDVGNFLVPAFLAGPCIERDQVAVGRLEEQVVAVDADAAIADVNAAARAPEVVPELPAGAGVDSVGVIGRG